MTIVRIKANPITRSPLASTLASLDGAQKIAPEFRHSLQGEAHPVERPGYFLGNLEDGHGKWEMRLTLSAGRGSDPRSKPTLFTFFLAVFAASLLADIPPGGCGRRNPGPPVPPIEAPAPPAGPSSGA